MGETGLRIDRLLFFLRLAKSRSLAHNWAEAGHVRINGVRILKGSAGVKCGDVLTFPKGDDVLVIKILMLPTRRGPPSEARACYQPLN